MAHMTIRKKVCHKYKNSAKYPGMLAQYWETKLSHALLKMKKKKIKLKCFVLLLIKCFYFFGIHGILSNKDRYNMKEVNKI